MLSDDGQNVLHCIWNIKIWTEPKFNKRIFKKKKKHYSMKEVRQKENNCNNHKLGVKHDHHYKGKVTCYTPLSFLQDSWRVDRKAGEEGGWHTAKGWDPELSQRPLQGTDSPCTWGRHSTNWATCPPHTPFQHHALHNGADNQDKSRGQSFQSASKSMCYQYSDDSAVIQTPVPCLCFTSINTKMKI